MLRCRKVMKLADKYVDGELSFYQRLTFRMHLALCKHCHAYIKNLSFLVRKVNSSQSNCKCSDVSEIDRIYDLIKHKGKNPPF